MASALLAGLLSCCALAPNTGSAAEAAQAEAPKMTVEVLQVIKKAQEAIQGKRYDDALIALSSIRGKTDLNITERDAMERLLVSAWLAQKMYAAAIPSMEWLVSSPSVADKDRLPVLENLVAASLGSKDFARATRWARECLQAGCSNPNKMATIVVQTLQAQGLHKEVIEEVQKNLAAMQASPGKARKVTEEELRAMAASQAKLKDMAGYYQSLQLLVQDYPSKDYWMDLLSRFMQQSHVNQRFEIEVYRLIKATDNLQEPGDYFTYAQLALKAGFPQEARSALAQGQAAKVFPGDVPPADLNQLQKEVQRAADEDSKGLENLRKTAQTANQWVDLGNVLFSTEQWAAAADAFDKGLALGGVKRESDVRLHLGIARFKAGQNDQARQALAQTGADTQAVANLWLMLLNAKP
jgi:Tfp pilus assembly protein PilF